MLATLAILHVNYDSTTCNFTCILWWSHLKNSFYIMNSTCNTACIPDKKHQGLLQPQGSLVGHNQIVWCQISQRSASRFWGRPLGHRGSQGHRGHLGHRRHQGHQRHQGHEKPLGHLCWYPVAVVMTEGSSGTHTQSLESSNFALLHT